MMCRCNFCQREFENSQGAKAHLRTCQKYQQHKQERGTAKVLGGSPTLTDFPDITQPATDLANSFAALTEKMIRQCAGPDEATTRKKKREMLIAQLCSDLVGCYHPQEGKLTPEMVVVAKVAILDEFSGKAIEEMPQAELILRATVIRDRVLAPYFRRQEERFQRQAERTERQEAQRKRDTRRSLRDAAIQSRQLKRKAALIELGTARALESAAQLGLTNRSLVLFEWEVRGRLELFIVGDEPEQQVDEHIKAAIERPLVDWKARVEHTKNIERERIVEKCMTVAMPVVEASIPWIRDTLVRNLHDRFGFQPPSPTANDASASAEQSKSTDPRARQQQQGSPTADVAERAPSPDSEAPVIKLKRTATS